MIVGANRFLQLSKTRVFVLELGNSFQKPSDGLVRYGTIDGRVAFTLQKQITHIPSVFQRP